MLMTSTATLIEKAGPYSVALEFARGKVNQLRNQLADWQFGGLVTPPALQAAIQSATIRLGKAIASSPSAESIGHARQAISQAYAAADQLVRIYSQQVFQIRHQRQPRLDTTLGCRLGAAVPTETLSVALRDTFNTVCLPLTWPTVEQADNDFQWGPHDQLLDWAITTGFHVVGGPLIDFHESCLPPWLRQREMSLAALASLACRYVDTVVRRYRGRIRTWQLTAAANACTVAGLAEEEVLWLTLRIAEAARQHDPNVELLIGLSQPWGEYQAKEAKRNSPFVFADTLLRSGLNLAGLNLEMVMGVWPRGSYCRDLLDASRLMDLYSLLGLPLHITLGLPSSAGSDSLASPGLGLAAGRWRDGFTPAAQAEWAEAFTGLALCKPAVRSVLWAHLSDAEPHQFPACGLVDDSGTIKPAMARLQQLRAAHLR